MFTRCIKFSCRNNKSIYNWYSFRNIKSILIEPNGIIDTWYIDERQQSGLCDRSFFSFFEHLPVWTGVSVLSICDSNNHLRNMSTNVVNNFENLIKCIHDHKNNFNMDIASEFKGLISSCSFISQLYGMAGGGWSQAILHGADDELIFKLNNVQLRSYHGNVETMHFLTFTEDNVTQLEEICIECPITKHALTDYFNLLINLKRLSLDCYTFREISNKLIIIKNQLDYLHIRDILHYNDIKFTIKSSCELFNDDHISDIKIRIHQKFENTKIIRPVHQCVIKFIPVQTTELCSKQFSIKMNNEFDTSFKVGRDPRVSDFLFTDTPVVSRIHCEFVMDDFTLFCRDLKSTNGAFINGIRIDQTGKTMTKVNHNDINRFGKPVQLINKLYHHEYKVQIVKKTNNDELANDFNHLIQHLTNDFMLLLQIRGIEMCVDLNHFKHDNDTHLVNKDENGYYYITNKGCKICGYRERWKMTCTKCK